MELYIPPDIINDPPPANAIDPTASGCANMDCVILSSLVS